MKSCWRRMVSTAVSTDNCNTKQQERGTGMGYIVAALLAIAGVVTYRRWQARQREAYIDQFEFHPAILNKFREVRANLTHEQEQLVFAALRDYFQMCRMAGRRMVSMPSQVVDDAWHAFILFTRAYDQFCSRAFGRFLHHTPAEAMSSPSVGQQGIKRAWRLACARAGINPLQPLSLPLLFSIDRDLQISNGFHYVPDCGDVIRRTDASGNYCASHIGCSSGCSGDSGGSGAEGGGADSGCGGGCGGGD